MKRWKLWVVIGAVFFLGLGAGVLGSGYVFRRTLARVLSGEQGYNEALVIKKLARELDLTRSQQAAIRPVVDATFQELYALREEERPKLDAILRRGMERMRPLLSTDQLERLSALFRASQALRSGKARGSLRRPQADQ